MGLFSKSEIDKIIETGYKWPDKAVFFQEYYRSMKDERDGWAWFYGLGTPLIFVLSALYAYADLRDLSVPNNVLAAFLKWDAVSFGIILLVCIPFFWGMKWARKAMYFVPVGIAIAFNVILDGIINDNAKAEMTGAIIGRSIVGLLIYAAITSSSIPNKAFFRIPYDQAKTEKYWGAISNQYARYAAIAGILLPIFSFALILPLTLLGIVEEGSTVAKSLAAFSTIIMCGFVGWLGLKAFGIYAPNDILPILGRGYAVFGLIAAAAWVVLFLALLVFG